MLGFGYARMVTETSLPHSLPPGKPKLLDHLRSVLHFKHYRIRTETSSLDWIKRFILFHGKRHPNDVRKPEVATRFFPTSPCNRECRRVALKTGRSPALLFLTQKH